MTEQEHQKRPHRTITFKVRHLVMLLTFLLIVALVFVQLTKFNKQIFQIKEENQDSEKNNKSDIQATQTIKSEDSVNEQSQQKVITDNKIPAFMIAKRLGITIENRPSLGSENATVTIITFIDPTYTDYDYFYSNLLPQLRERYIENGKVRIIFKHYIHLALSRTLYETIRTESYQQYLKMFVIMNCAYKIDIEKFLLAQNAINKKFEDYFYTTDYDKVVTKFYSPLQLSSREFEIFKKCPIYAYGDEVVKIKEDFEDSKQLDIARTTFFINNEKIDGIQTFMTFDEIIKQKLGENVGTGECFSYQDCPEEQIAAGSYRCPKGGYNDCSYSNNLEYQACVDRCDKYDSYFAIKHIKKNIFTNK